MGTKYRILIMGAWYGSLLGTKLALAGHAVHLICLPAEADLINNEGAIVRMPVKGRDGLVEINSKKLPGRMSAGGTAGVNPSDYHLAALAMQEPQYRSPGVRELLAAVAKTRVPSMSIMNMPPLPYLKRIPGIDADALRSCYTDASVWDAFDPKLVTLCSPDPQAFRPPEEKVNVLQVCVSLGANEKDLVPFEKYANAALSLLTPSSAARALANGAPNIERTDRLVQTIAAHKGMRLAAVDQTVALVDGWLERNRKKAA